MNLMVQRTLSQIERLVDALTPSVTHATQHTQAQHRLLVYIGLITAVFSLQYMLVSWIIGFPIGIALEAGCCVAHIALLWFFQRWGRYELSCNLYLASSFWLAIVGCTYFTGGINSMVFPWFSLIPITSMLLMGSGRSTIFWCLTCCTVAIVIGVASLEGYEYPLAYDTDYIHFFNTICVSGLVLIIFFIAMAFDHNRSLSLKKIIEQNEALRQARRMAEIAVQQKSEFLANMSHEIRTPMNAIIGFADLCLKTDLSRKQQDYLGKIDRSAHALLQIINDILDFSKIEAGKMSIFNLENVVSDVASQVAVATSDKNLELVVSIAPNVPPNLIGDPFRLSQALMNLAGNAVKFTAEGHVRIGVTLQNLHADECVLCFSIEDTGIGVDEAKIPSLFEAFNQADTSVTREFGGTGLGLSITRFLVNQMHGQITVQSQPGEGSVFSFTAKLKLSKNHSSVNAEASAALHGLKVLVVDDNEIAREVLSEQLQHFNFEVDAVTSGEEALNVLKDAATSRPYDLMLIDWKMPGLDGVETVRQMRQQNDLGQIPVTIMVSAFARDEILKQAGSVGINALLTKPISASALLDTIMDSFGHGSKFNASSDVQITNKPEALLQIRGARVLVVEDNPLNQQVITELLRDAGLLVDVANNGIEAIAAVHENAYELVLMDVQMPQMGGYEATRHIRAENQFVALPIIAMTAHAMKGIREECLSMGMNDYLSKPIDPAWLYTLLINWIKPGKRERKIVSVQNVQHEYPIGLPERLPGLDHATGLGRLNQNASLYKQLVLDCVARYDNAPAKLRSWLAVSDFAQAEAMVHSMKGILGNLAAERTFKICQQLEATLRLHQLPSESQLFEFENALSEVQTSATILTMLNGANEVVVLDNQENTTISSQMERLIAQIRYSDPLAEFELKKLIQLLPANDQVEGLKELQTSLYNFDFESALAAAFRVARQFDIQVE